MQDRYAGDIGDFGKFGLLKALLAEGFSLGVNWYKAKPRKASGTKILAPFSMRMENTKSIRSISCVTNPWLVRCGKSRKVMYAPLLGWNKQLF